MLKHLLLGTVVALVTSVSAVADVHWAPSKPFAKLSDALPITEMQMPSVSIIHPRSIVYILTTSVGVEDEWTKDAFILLIADDREGIAYFTRFNCKDHTYAIPGAAGITIDSDKQLWMHGTLPPMSPRSQAFTPTEDGAWGKQAEEYVCSGKVPKYEPGLST